MSGLHHFITLRLRDQRSEGTPLNMKQTPVYNDTCSNVKKVPLYLVEKKDAWLISLNLRFQFIQHIIAKCLLVPGTVIDTWNTTLGFPAQMEFAI